MPLLFRFRAYKAESGGGGDSFDVGYQNQKASEDFPSMGQIRGRTRG